jgi:hypothetical protein
MDWDQARQGAVLAINSDIAERVKELIEQKHLYQKVSLNGKEIIAEWRARLLTSGYATRFDSDMSDISEEIVLGGASYAIDRAGTKQTFFYKYNPAHVKLFCDKCDRREVFKPVWYRELINELKKPTQGESSVVPWKRKEVLQLFILVYQCQSCLGPPECLMVRRSGWNLQLEGRSPMEQLELPTFLPRQERPFYRDALIAIDAGKTLAALFYLRTFLEQFGRRVAEVEGRLPGVEIMSAYAETLPIKHRDSMPSLREWYDKLSAAIHSAKEDAELFEDARKQIEQHFKVRDVFGIPEKAVVSKK